MGFKRLEFSKFIFIPFLGIIALLFSTSCFTRKEFKQEVELYSDPTMPLIKLPTHFKTYRQNGGASLDAGDRYDILNVEGPGCVRSIWLLRAQGKRIEIVADGVEVPQVDMPLPNFFGTLLNIKPYHINSAAIIAMPNEWVRDNFGGGEPGYTLYLPIPFQDSVRITVHADTIGGLSSLVNWHKYDKNINITPYRFHAVRKIMNPALPRGNQMEMVDISGSGFVGGIFMGVIQKTFDDLMYHHGGLTWLIDGENDPHAIRGVNMEDDYGFTWGFHNTQTHWFGVPYHKVEKLSNPIHQTPIFTYAQEAVVYRFLGPDPISFSSSLNLKTGTRPDDTETIVYYYKKINSEAEKILTPVRWQVIGTIPIKTKEDFEKPEPEAVFTQWKDSVKLNGMMKQVFETDLNHGWLNFHPMYFTEAWTPFALTEQAVFAKGVIEAEKDQEKKLKISFDDWIAIWINGERVLNLYHEEEFKSAEIPVHLKKGENEIIIKSVNFNSIPNNQLWALNVFFK